MYNICSVVEYLYENSFANLYCQCLFNLMLKICKIYINKPQINKTPLPITISSIITVIPTIILKQRHNYSIALNNSTEQLCYHVCNKF